MKRELIDEILKSIGLEGHDAVNNENSPSQSS